ncbi:MAG: class I tRNA ligase family protein [Clostridiales bacterium]|nr:class I tRNA ligase family protein [Clostridiales bacterium]
MEGDYCPLALPHSSKSRGNVINPDDIVDEYGADTLRLYVYVVRSAWAATWR